MASGGALDWLRRNVRKNESLAEERGCQVVASGETTDGRVRLERVSGRRPERQRLRRADDAGANTRPRPRSVAGSIPGSPTLDAVPWDFIVGSDLVYDENGVRCCRG